jgi:serine/threonine protein kinase
VGGRAAEEFGPYLVYEQLGIGGMATVHRAETTGIEGFRRPVALKRMLPHVAANDDLVRSFVREARLASHLRHANVAQTYDLGKVDDIYFIAMELVVGRTLRDVLRLCAKRSILIPIPIALNILTQVCDALDYAHNLTDDSGAALGIIHRDVSPSNVIVAEGGVVKLIDFGIAKASTTDMQTMSGTIKGKFGYMAPEYLGGTIDARADLFALGIIAYEMLTGRPLFQGRDDMDTLYRVKSMKIAPPSVATPDVPMEIDSIVMTALERDPEARWQRAAAMRVALTTEVKRLGMTIIDQEVTRWVDAIFTDALGDTSTPAPTRVMSELPRASAYPNDESIIIERPPTEETAVVQARATPSPPRAPAQNKTLLGGAAVGPLPPRTGPRLTKPAIAVPPVAPLALPVGRPDRLNNLTIFLLLIVAAVASGAVVYFGLPYVTS